MDHLARIEPLVGRLGEVGSTYRLVQKEGGRSFIATVIARDLPREVRLDLDDADMHIAITDRFETLPNGRTRLISKEVFESKGMLRRMLMFLGRSGMRKAHRRHMEAFRRFAERSAERSRD